MIGEAFLRKQSTTALFVLLAAGAALGQQKPVSWVPGQLVVQTRLGANPSVVARTLATHGASVKSEIPEIGVHVLRVPEPAINQVQQALAGTGLFTFVERDPTVHVVATPNDPDFVSEWHLAKIQAPNAWGITTGSAAITIAFVDSGVDPT